MDDPMPDFEGRPRTNDEIEARKARIRAWKKAHVPTHQTDQPQSLRQVPRITRMKLTAPGQDHDSGWIWWWMREDGLHESFYTVKSTGYGF